MTTHKDLVEENERLKKALEQVKQDLPSSIQLDRFHDAKWSDSLYGEMHHLLAVEIPALIDDALYPPSNEPIQLLTEEDIPF